MPLGATFRMIKLAAELIGGVKTACSESVTVNAASAFLQKGHLLAAHCHAPRGRCPPARLGGERDLLLLALVAAVGHGERDGSRCHREPVLGLLDGGSAGGRSHHAFPQQLVEHLAFGGRHRRSW